MRFRLHRRTTSDTNDEHASEVLDAIRRATDLIERHAEASESLARSLGSLKEATDQLTATTRALRSAMAPMGGAAGRTRRTAANGDQRSEEH